MRFSGSIRSLLWRIALLLVPSADVLSFSPYIGTPTPFELRIAVRDLVEQRQSGELDEGDEPTLTTTCDGGPARPGLRTHPWLAEQAIAAFERTYSPLALTTSQKINLIRGTIEEDLDLTGTATKTSLANLDFDECLTGFPLHHNRVVNHFYDGVAGLPRLGDPATEWASRSSVNLKDWQDALLGGDTPHGWRALGQVLHVLQDMGVPAHVRNDTHTTFLLDDADPHEVRLKDLSYHAHGKFGTLRLDSIQASAHGFRNPKQFLEFLSSEVRNSFFSKGTLFESSSHGRPLPVKENAAYNFESRGPLGFYVTDQSGRFLGYYTRFFLLLMRFEPRKYRFPHTVQEAQDLAAQRYLIVDHEVVVRNYWQEVAPKIIALSAELIKLFYDTVTRPSELGPNVGDIEYVPMLSGIGGIAVEASGNTALVVEASEELSRVDLATGQVSTIAAVPGLRATPALEPDGETAIVVTSGSFPGEHGLSRVELVTGEVTSIIERGLRVPGSPAGVAVSLDGQSVFVTGSEGGLFEVELTTGRITKVSNDGGSSIAIEPGGASALLATGIFGGSRGFFSNCELARVDLTTGVAETVAFISCGGRPTGVTIEPGGDSALVVTSRQFAGNSGGIFRVDTISGEIDRLAVCAHCAGPQIAIIPPGDAALIRADVGRTLLHFDLKTFGQTPVAHGDRPVGVALDPDGDAVTPSFGTRFTNGTLSRIDLNTGIILRVAQTRSPQGGIDIDQSGASAFITAIDTGLRNALVQRITLGSGDVSTAVELPFRSTAGLALEGASNSALVTAIHENSLVRADLLSGDTSVITEQLISPTGVIVEEPGLSVLMIENDHAVNGALSRVDLRTGEVATIATDIGRVGGSLDHRMVLEPLRQSVLVTAGSGSGPVDLVRVDLTNGSVSTIAASICRTRVEPFLSGITLEAGGDVALLSSPRCGLIRVRVLPAGE